MAKKDAAPLTDGEIEMMRRHYESQPISQRIAYSRALRLSHCLNFRKWITKGGAPGADVEACRFFLKDAQRSLLDLRRWRETGIYPSKH